VTAASESAVTDVLPLWPVISSRTAVEPKSNHTCKQEGALPQIYRASAFVTEIFDHGWGRGRTGKNFPVI